jgi:hypothetical protein
MVSPISLVSLVFAVAIASVDCNVEGLEIEFIRLLMCFFNFCLKMCFDMITENKKTALANGKTMLFDNVSQPELILCLLKQGMLFLPGKTA